MVAPVLRALLLHHAGGTPTVQPAGPGHDALSRPGPACTVDTVDRGRRGALVGASAAALLAAGGFSSAAAVSSPGTVSAAPQQAPATARVPYTIVFPVRAQAQLRSLTQVRLTYSSTLSCALGPATVTAAKVIIGVRAQCTPRADTAGSGSATLSYRISGALSSVTARMSWAAVPADSLGSPVAWAPLMSQKSAPGVPVRWNPCVPTMPVKVNYGVVPRASAEPLVTAAIANVAARSGLPLSYAGTTTFTPTKAATTSPATAPIVMAFADPGVGWGRSDILPGGSVLGVGGFTSVSGYTVGYGIASAFVVVDTRVRALSAGTTGRQVAVLMHELGHAVGLGHVSDTHQVMYPSILVPFARWGAGDVTGLAKVGRPAGCLVRSATAASARSVAVPEYESTAIAN